MDSQGEKFVPDSTGNQVPFGGLSSNQPDQNVNVAQNGVSSSGDNVAQHILGGINNPQDEVTTQTPSTPLDVLVTPPNQTTISSADVVPVDPTEAAQVHAALSHPYFSNHPTQTAASGVGDIVIGNPASAKRRSLPRSVVFGLIGLIAILIISGIALVISSISGGANNSLANELRSYASAVAGVEENFYRASQNLIDFGEVVTDDFVDSLNRNLANTTKLQEKLNKREQGSLSNEVWAQLTEVRDILNTRIPMWQASLDFYQQVRNAYQQRDTAYFDELQNSENGKIADVGWTFYSYFWFDQYWQDKLNESGCNNPTSSASCIEIRESREEATDNLLSNAPVVMSMFSSYDDTLYTADSLVYKKLEKVIGEVE